MANQYFLRSRRSENEARQIIRYFADEFTETATAKKLGLARKNSKTSEFTQAPTDKEIDLIRRSVNRHFLKIRRAIYSHERHRLSIPLKKLPIDRKYLLSNIQSNEYDSASKKAFPLIAVMFNDGQLISDVICTVSKPLLHEISKNLEISCRRNEIFDYGIMGSKFNHTNLAPNFGRLPYTDPNRKYIHLFWSISEARLKAFFGISPATFLLHLKESQWRFNNITSEEVRRKNPRKNLYRKLLKLLRNNPT